MFVSDIPEMKELVEDKRTGRIFAISNTQSLTSLLEEYHQNESDQLSSIADNAHAQYIKQYQFINMYQSYINIYKQLVNKVSK